MNQSFTFLLLLTAMLPLHLNAQEQVFCKDYEAIIRQEAGQHGSLLEFRSNPATHNYDLKYHRMEWTIDPNIRYIKGTVTSFFVPAESDFQELNFDLTASLVVTGVSRKGQELAFSQSSEDLLTIFLPEPLPEGVPDSVSVSYEGVPPEDGFGSFVQGTHNGQPITWTLSEPYGAKNWWPCKQDLNDKVDSIDVWVTTPAAYRVAGNGLLVEERELGEYKLYHWNTAIRSPPIWWPSA